MKPKTKKKAATMKPVRKSVKLKPKKQSIARPSPLYEDDDTPMEFSYDLNGHELRFYA